MCSEPFAGDQVSGVPCGADSAEWKEVAKPAGRVVSCPSGWRAGVPSQQKSGHFTRSKSDTRRRAPECPSFPAQPTTTRIRQLIRPTHTKLGPARAPHPPPVRVQRAPGRNLPFCGQPPSLDRLSPTDPHSPSPAHGHPRRRRSLQRSLAPAARRLVWRVGVGVEPPCGRGQRPSGSGRKERREGKGR